ncbi:MAG TPA: hypothetical protein VFB60_15550 [Ktedonobacteraceae bacterium]|nr:hypothetical protein [Ktedonobacteraceae bacterium]
MSQSIAKRWSGGMELWSWLRGDAPQHPFITSPRLRIFLVSFTMLFFELLCIRWIPSYVRFLSYFTNFVLMASFLGIGLGMLSARRKRFWYPPFPVLVLALTIIVALNKFDLRISSTQVLYYGAGEAQSVQAENFIVLPIIFGLVTLCFIPLARSFGQLFSQTKPLTAYTYDIIGSLAGIATFSIMSFFTLPPALWFIVLGLLILLLESRQWVIGSAAVLAASLVVVWQLQQGAYWSPYYKILLHPATPTGYIIDVNNAGGHQAMVPWQYKEPFYRRVYEIFPGHAFHKALILGAGSGSDVATALHYGVDSITAVEIDPTIQKLGAQLNPDHAYQDPRVKVVINDGRSFLQNDTNHYDLIIFALPDSLTLTSGNTSLRLESFLLTQESISAARARLTSNGIVVLYNYYRETWLVDKLAGMAGRAFNQDPLVSTYGGWGRAAVIMAGPRLASLPPGAFGTYHENPPPDNKTLRVIGEGYYPVSGRTPATDDWPFLYLQQQSFPLIYIEGLLMVLVFALGGTLTFAPRKVLRRFDWHMFFLGVAFMLLEVKSLTTFALLFGSTWLVNSLVFFAILSSVLLAIVVNRWLQIRRIWIFYLLLFGVLLLNLFLPPEALLLSNPVLRYVLASVLAFTPVFLANIVFTNSFRDSEAADIAFASNLIGIMIGGGLEYFSMLVGYRMLLIPVIIFYACAMLLRMRRKEGTATAEAAGASEPSLVS